jgi:hypothetical protein
MECYPYHGMERQVFLVGMENPVLMVCVYVKPQVLDGNKYNFINNKIISIL